jgi:glycosyltransferase involved in cell wall biosynthesis
VHLHTFGSQVVGTRAARRVGAGVVRTEHSTRVYDDPSCWPFSRWSLARADVAVCISEHVREVALAKAPWARAKLRVVPNGVDLARFTRAPSPELAGGERVRFVAVGRLEPRKGLDLALEALADVPRAELVVVGEGEERGRLEALAARLGLGGRVRFAGFSRDVREHIAGAHLALSSARAEGLGIALIEAMAMGRAIVALPTGGVPELVRDGDTGWLAHGGGSAALARAMRDAVEAGPAEIGRRGARALELARARYSVGAMRTAYERIYEEFSRTDA